jgi:homoserine dehydrogenase
MLGYKKGLESGLKLLSRDDIVTQYYIRLEVADQSGVLAEVTSTLGKFGISIETMLQKPTDNEKIAKLLFTTHRCKESEMQEAITALGKLDVVRGEIAMMRIEK